MVRPKDEYDDAFFNYVGDMAERAHGLERMLTYIRDNFGQVCEEFAYTCQHASCNSSCAAWLIADAALKGRYALPGEPEAAEDPLDFDLP